MGHKRIVNWLNFINFLKNESKRIKDKIYNNDTKNIKYSQKKENLEMKNTIKTNVLKKNLKRKIILLNGLNIKLILVSMIPF